MENKSYDMQFKQMQQERSTRPMAFLMTNSKETSADDPIARTTKASAAQSVENMFKVSNISNRERSGSPPLSNEHNEYTHIAGRA